jgi:chromosome segregation ATPase
MSMNDYSHRHHVGDVQGAAEDRHSHSPRDIGAADDHDLEMLRREVRTLEGRLAEALRQHGELIRQHAELSRSHADLADTTTDLAGAVKTLVAEVSNIVTTLRRLFP